MFEFITILETIICALLFRITKPEHDSFLSLLKAASKLIFSLIPIGATQPPTQRCSTGTDDFSPSNSNIKFLTKSGICEPVLTSPSWINLFLDVQIAHRVHTITLQKTVDLDWKISCNQSLKLLFSSGIGQLIPKFSQVSFAVRHSWNKCSLDSTPFWHLLQEADPLSLRYCRLLKVGKKLRETRQAVIFILEGRSKFHSFL
ncbi:hypothetical protein V6Z11_A05G080600 [Gossypium hirsutum]